MITDQEKQEMLEVMQRIADLIYEKATSTEESK